MDWNNIKAMVLVAAAAAGMCACTEKDNMPSDGDTNQVPSQYQKVTVNTEILTKTTFNDDRTALAWSEGDAISVFNNADNAVEKLEYSSDAMTLTQVPNEAAELYAYYPYASFENGPSSVTVQIPAEQAQAVAGTFDGSRFPMAAKATIVDGAVDFSFAPLASAMAINVYKSNLTGTEKLEKIRITPTVQNFAGSASFDLTADNVAFTEGDRSEPVVLTLTEPYELTTEGTEDGQEKNFAGQVYVVLAKQTYASVKFEIQTSRGLYVITSSADAPIDLASHDMIAFDINLHSAAYTYGATLENQDISNDYYLLFKNGEDLVIGGKTYNISDYPNAYSNTYEELTSSDFTANCASILFIDDKNSAAESYSIGTDNVNVVAGAVVVGRYKDSQPKLTFIPSSNTKYLRPKGDVTFKNLNIECTCKSLFNSNQLSSDASVVLEDCTIKANKGSLFFEYKTTKSFKEIIVDNSIIALATGTNPMYFIDEDSVAKTKDYTDAFTKFSITNSVITSADGNYLKTQIFKSSNASVATDNLDFVFNNNTVYGLFEPNDPSLVQFKTLGGLHFSNNIIYCTGESVTGSVYLLRPTTTLNTLLTSQTMTVTGNNAYVYQGSGDTYYSANYWSGANGKKVRGESAIETTVTQLTASPFASPETENWYYPSAIDGAGASYATKLWEKWSE